jgi:hypothetical protein
VNFCEYFKPNQSAYDPKTQVRQKIAGNEFESLFGDAATDPLEEAVDPPDQDSPEQPAKRNGNPLDDLFDD